VIEADLASWFDTSIAGSQQHIGGPAACQTLLRHHRQTLLRHHRPCAGGAMIGGYKQRFFSSFLGLSSCIFMFGRT
jgi:hypothetical protein